MTSPRPGVRDTVAAPVCAARGGDESRNATRVAFSVERATAAGAHVTDGTEVITDCSGDEVILPGNDEYEGNDEIE